MRALLWVLPALMIATPALADAPTAEERAAAQVLFDEARDLLEKKRFAVACPKFAESMRLDPAVGTQLNLARCYEESGKLASAWINWVEAAQRAEAAGRPDRAELARGRADKLEPRLSYLVIRVEGGGNGVRVQKDGQDVGRAQWGVEVPVDRGTHVITAEAPGRHRFDKTIRVTREKQRITVKVPPLEEESTVSAGQLGAGIALGVVGLAGLGLGIGFGVAAGGKNDDSLAECPVSPTRCSAEGVELRDEAFTFAHVSTAGFIAGGALLVTGVILVATAFGGSSEGAGEGAALYVAPDGVRLRGWW
jgi:hypothetical protein